MRDGVVRCLLVGGILTCRRKHPKPSPKLSSKSMFLSRTPRPAQPDDTATGAARKAAPVPAYCQPAAAAEAGAPSSGFRRTIAAETSVMMSPTGNTSRKVMAMLKRGLA